MNVELFGCSGGMALGFRQAGIEFHVVVDASEHACRSYRQNLGRRPRQMDARDFLEKLKRGWRPYGKRWSGCDLLVADPPCTPWSRAGKRLGQDDERDMLAVTMSIIEVLRPARWVIANVPGLDDAGHWDSVVKPVIGHTAVRLGYCVDYASLNAANYGVPQTRVRPFWFAHRAGTACIQWPRPTHADPGSLRSATLPGIDPLKPWVTCREALGHLSLEELGKPVLLRWRNPDEKRRRLDHAGDADRPARTQTATRPGPRNSATLVVNPKHMPASPDAPSPTVTAKDRCQSSDVLAVHDRHPPSDLDAPARTQVFGNGVSPPGSVLAMSRDLHPPSDADKPSQTITSQSHHRPDGVIAVGDGPKAMMRPQEAGRPARTLTGNRQDSSHILAERRVGQWASGGSHQPSRADRPALVQTAAAGSSTSQLMEAGETWPWSTLPSLSTEDGRYSRGVKLSERARLILQGFPEDWVLDAPTKTARSSMLGQAMPPPLAAVVARSIRDHIKAT